jgi:hypothetical protein
MTHRLGSALLLTVAALLLQGLYSRAASPGRAGLVVQVSDTTVITRCVTFAEEQISGVDLLARSGLAFEVATDPAFGAFVCKIDRAGCAAEECLCEYPPDYWRYWLLVDGAWQSSSVGASSRVLRDGAVDGWSWTADAPPAVAFADICPSEAENRVYLPLVTSAGAATVRHSGAPMFQQTGMLQEQATDPQHAGVMVEFADGSVETACVAWDEGLALTSEELLRQSGLEVLVGQGDYGETAVCKIGANGCDVAQGENCYCQYDANSEESRLWLAYQLRNGGWHKPVGPPDVYVSRRNVYDGDVEAWVWGYPGEFDGQNATRPSQVMTFGEICALATPTPTSSATGTVTPTGTATGTVTATPTGTDTPTPTRTRRPSATPPDDTATPTVTPTITPSSTPTGTPTVTAEAPARLRSAPAGAVYLPLIMQAARPMGASAAQSDRFSEADLVPLPATTTSAESVATATLPLPPATSVPPPVATTSIPATGTPTLPPPAPTITPTLPPPSPTPSPEATMEPTSLPFLPDDPSDRSPLPTRERTLVPTPDMREQPEGMATPTAVVQVAAAVVTPGTSDAPEVRNRVAPAHDPDMHQGERDSLSTLLILGGLFILVFTSLILVLYLQQRHPSILEAEE